MKIFGFRTDGCIKIKQFEDTVWLIFHDLELHLYTKQLIQKQFP